MKSAHSHICKLANQRLRSAYIVFLTSYILLSGCSISKQIAQSAKTDVLSVPAIHNAHIGISIFEPATNKYWFNYQGDQYFVPASNTKLPTCYAAMKYLGDSLVGLRYSVKSDSVIVISGTGDPTFLHPDFRNQSVYNFLKPFKAVIFKSKGFQDFLGSGWSWNDYQEYYMAQRSELPIYGNLVKFTWINKSEIKIFPKYFKYSEKVSRLNPELSERLDEGFEIYKEWSNNTFIAGYGKSKSAEVPFSPNTKTIADLLADTLKKQVDYYNEFFTGSDYLIRSQPTDSLLKPMMHRSDNFFAEQSLLMVSNERLGYMNDAKIIDTLLKTDFKDLPQKPRWVDGSGLSRYNLFTPQDFVAILNKMKNEFGMERIKVILPTGGEGTISSYYKADSNYIYGKTGTLSGVVAFSGFLYTKKGKLLIFSTLVNNHNASATDVRRAVEKFLQNIRNKY
jgi:D-alanyl-D-alanine carboxypeptidase/D-alanyl-D-alanine-endopeptidase (penicillin-binding protein 4)